MTYEATELQFLATPEKGDTSALLVRPEGASHLLVLGHGASSTMRHATLRTIAERLADAGIATFRYNFPYAERGAARDSRDVCIATVRAAHDLHGRRGIRPRRRSRPRLLRVPPASPRKTGHEAGGPSQRGHYPDA